MKSKYIVNAGPVFVRVYGGHKTDNNLHLLPSLILVKKANVVRLEVAFLYLKAGVSVQR